MFPSAPSPPPNFPCPVPLSCTARHSPLRLPSLRAPCPRPVQNERSILTPDLRHRNIVRLLHTFASRPTEAMLVLVHPDTRAAMEPRDAVTGQSRPVQTQFYVMDYVPQVGGL